jgi:hypothetical protein
MSTGQALAFDLPATPAASGPGVQGALFDLTEVEGFGKLTRREKDFAEGIFAGLSQRQAARSAGVKGDDASVDVIAHRLMRSPDVRRFLGQAWQRSGASIDETLRQAARVQARAMTDYENATNREARAAAIKEWRDASTLIASIHGRLSVRVDGQINHQHGGHVNVIHESALPALAEIRRAVVAQRLANESSSVEVT